MGCLNSKEDEELTNEIANPGSPTVPRPPRALAAARLRALWGVHTY